MDYFVLKFNKFFYYYLHEPFQSVVTCNIGKILINGGRIQELLSITVWYFVIIQVRAILEKTVVSFLSLFRILLHNKENLLKSTRPMHIKSFFSEYYLSQKSLRMYIIHTHSIVFKAVFKIAFLLLRDWVDFHPEEVVWFWGRRCCENRIRIINQNNHTWSQIVYKAVFKIVFLLLMF